MTYYVINFEFSNQLHGETVAPCKLSLATITNHKRREIKTSKAIFFRTERSCYVRFNVNKERWTIELGVDFIEHFMGQIHLQEADVYCNDAGPECITGTPFTWDCFASFSKKSKKCNKKVDTKAVRDGLKPLLFTIGDGRLTEDLQGQASVMSMPVKFGPSNNTLVELPTVTFR